MRLSLHNGTPLQKKDSYCDSDPQHARDRDPQGPMGTLGFWSLDPCLKWA